MTSYAGRHTISTLPLPGPLHSFPFDMVEKSTEDEHLGVEVNNHGTKTPRKVQWASNLEESVESSTRHLDEQGLNVCLTLSSYHEQLKTNQQILSTIARRVP